jgi:hypothetical protein
MPLDMNTALSQYGYTQALVNSNPELKAKFEQAVREEWDSARFDREIKSTGWYQTLTERQRQIAVQRSTDPATFAQTVANKRSQIEALSARLGLSGVGHQWWAEAALLYEWDDQVLQTKLIDAHSARGVSGGFTGLIGEAENHIKQTWAQYGLDISDATVAQWSKEIAAGRQTLGGLDNEARNYAKKSYPAFAAQLDSGMTLADIASPYMQTMANTLELSGGAVSLKDPFIKKALQGTNGQPLAMWDFERQLKDDARWQFTKQAKDETYAVLQQVGQDWGFL